MRKMALIKQCSDACHISGFQLSLKEKETKLKKYLFAVVKMEHDSVEISCRLGPVSFVVHELFTSGAFSKYGRICNDDSAGAKATAAETNINITST
jgi:hypothetical protein